MGHYLGLLLLLCTYVTISRACSSKGGVQDKVQDIIPPPTTPSFDDDYFDYATYDLVDKGPKVVSSKVTRGDFPHQVSLQATKKQNEHFCSASIIHPKFLLSAAHCLKNRTAGNIRAVAGQHDLLMSDGNTAQIRNVTHLILHENYNDRTHDSDIALLELNERLHFDNTHVRPIALWDSEWEHPKLATVSDWWQDKVFGTLPRSLMAAEVHVRDRQSCAGKLPVNTMGRNMICASGFGDPCHGDSGASLTCSKNLANGKRQHYLCGVVSYGIDCNRTDNSSQLTVYTDVSKYNQWIQTKLPVKIYFGVQGGEGIRTYSESERTNRTVLRSAEGPEGLAFNWANGKLYYTGANKIYSVDEDGTNVRTVFESKQYGTVKGLAFDGITGNLYGVSAEGFVFVCKIRENERLSCTYLLRGQGNLLGIALDPNNGQMYWTCGPDTIMRAQMDGTNVITVLSGLGQPVGITIDLDESRLLWSEYGSQKICSSAMDGSDIFVVADNETETGDGGLSVRHPWGIAVHNDYVYWGNSDLQSLHRCSKWVGNAETVLTGQGYIKPLTTNKWNFHITRPNDCEGKNFGGICVLTTKSYRCVG